MTRLNDRRAALARRARIEKTLHTRLLEADARTAGQVVPLRTQEMAKAISQTIGIPIDQARSELMTMTSMGDAELPTSTLSGIARGYATTGYGRASMRELAAEGYTHKKWVAHKDDRTRPDHVKLNGQQRPIDVPFSTPEGVTLMMPGDPTAPADQRYGCRCVMTGLENTRLSTSGWLAAQVTHTRIDVGELITEQVQAALRARGGGTGLLASGEPDNFEAQVSRIALEFLRHGVPLDQDRMFVAYPAQIPEDLEVGMTIRDSAYFCVSAHTDEVSDGWQARLIVAAGTVVLLGDDTESGEVVLPAGLVWHVDDIDTDERVIVLRMDGIQ